MDLAEADAAKLAVINLEQRIADGEAVTVTERLDVHATYQAAERWRSEYEADQRRAEQQAQGIVPGPTQGISIGA